MLRGHSAKLQNEATGVMAHRSFRDDSTDRMSPDVGIYCVVDVMSTRDSSRSPHSSGKKRAERRSHTHNARSPDNTREEPSGSRP